MVGRLLDIQPNAEHAPAAVYGCGFSHCAEEMTYPPEMLFWFPGATNGTIHELSNIANVIIAPGFYCEGCIDQTIADCIDHDDEYLTRFQHDALTLARFLAGDSGHDCASVIKDHKLMPIWGFRCSVCDRNHLVDTDTMQFPTLDNRPAILGRDKVQVPRTKTHPNPSFGCEMYRCEPDCPYYGT